MLKNLRTSLLLPAELAETVNAYLKSIQETIPDEPFIGKITAMLNEDLNQLNQAITAVRQNALVDDVAVSDAIRDDIFIGFRDLVDAYKRRRDADLQKAHKKLWNVIEKAGTTLYYLGYTDQSGKLEALFAEFDQVEYQEALTTLNILDVYSELKQAQADFTDLYDQRLSADAGLDYPTLKEAKGRIVPHVNSLLNAIAILHETEPERHAGLVEKLNVITTQVMSSARARKTRSTESAENLSV
ncbi:MAG: DUF6261 family protein [Reichenbachiella sp.]|uniref:DUF6261 family protein n=1 Tax=Reichenbachiella sp. TaxID=2184521 RepID=UPI00326535BD